ncbi:SMI1/KNR4 family protein [Paenibacillus sp. 598K]|uniref:SMI1/KNR4 family protein n=1 Tax=Paenibacillus sp. 598K TaxID=1117987 RepID=UPI001624F9B9|nr:SMI1/KNR4 family protein [Paenibacillus sp. 598K]
MYITSQRCTPVTEEMLAEVERAAQVRFPEWYRAFVHTYGEGTYRNWMNVQRPDDEVLKPFAEYELWEHDADSPITEAQIAGCISLGTSTDGDFLAVHPDVEGLLWLPRHDDRIRVIQPVGETYADLLDAIHAQVYQRSDEAPRWFEPWHEARTHAFYLFPKNQPHPSLTQLSHTARERWQPDLIIEDEYGCKLFYRALGGYLRFNYANETEVALIADGDTPPLKAEMENWLSDTGGQRMK